jgi:hypothetical protein
MERGRALKSKRVDHCDPAADAKAAGPFGRHRRELGQGRICAHKAWLEDVERDGEELPPAAAGRAISEQCKRRTIR